VTDPSGNVSYIYNKRFSWSASEREDALHALTPVARFVEAVGNENYWIYAVK
jgi:hypothetical protein